MIQLPLFGKIPPPINGLGVEKLGPDLTPPGENYFLVKCVDPAYSHKNPLHYPVLDHVYWGVIKGISSTSIDITLWRDGEWWPLNVNNMKSGSPRWSRFRFERLNDDGTTCPIPE